MQACTPLKPACVLAYQLLISFDTSSPNHAFLCFIGINCKLSDYIRPVRDRPISEFPQEPIKSREFEIGKCRNSIVLYK